jgi:hypothetical protein
MAISVALLLALSSFLSTPTAEPVPGAVFYLIVDSTSIRSQPDAKAPSVSKLGRFDVVSGRETVKGWLQIDGATSESAQAGWVALIPENIVRGPLESLKVRVFRVRNTKWPERVKLDVLRGHVREGFTGDQVRFALGDPVKKELRHSGNDVAEEWVYPDRRILFSHTGVRAIELIDVAQQR